MRMYFNLKVIMILRVILDTLNTYYIGPESLQICIDATEIHIFHKRTLPNLGCNGQNVYSTSFSSSLEYVIGRQDS